MAKTVIKPRTKKNPRILVVTPEITYLPEGMGNMANHLKAKAGGLADVSASLVSALYRQGADVHVALPDYRQIFKVSTDHLVSRELRMYLAGLADNRVHLAEDRIFYYRSRVYSSYSAESMHVALAFQREIINNIIPKVNPDLIHCNDWMTGLIPGMARRLGIPCLFTVHNIHTQKTTLAEIEDRGIDSATFWKELYYEHIPVNYEESRSGNPVDMLASGIFAAHFINTVSPTFLEEVVQGRFDFIPQAVRSEIRNKYHAGCASGILNAPDETQTPETDPALPENYTSKDHTAAKRRLKTIFQQQLGLQVNPDAPLFFWPSRLDPAQKGCQLLAEILYNTIDRYRHKNLQIAIVANGAYYEVFERIRHMHNINSHLAVAPFDNDLSQLGYAASDFMLMPSMFEPCGLPQMIAPKYGCLPVVH
ncbi:MAG: glycogen/starch synthase, partial [Lentisphaeria bacterium]|nr:glycogen/starch synthase [Lentisphaeria bacterium]